MKAQKFLGKHSLIVLDHTWAVYFCTNKQYKKATMQKDSRAVTNIKTKSLYINVSKIFGEQDKVIVHELVHIYFAELMGPDLAMKNPSRWEEFFCNLFEHRGFELLAKAIPLTKLMYKYSRNLNED